MVSIARCAGVTPYASWEEARPVVCLSASAWSSGTPSRSATEAVTSAPPMSRMRTKRGTPPWCTTMLVTLEPTSTRASAWVALKPLSAWAWERRTAKLVRSTTAGCRPAAVTACSVPSTMSRAAATSSTRRTRAPVSSVRSSSGWKSSSAWSTAIGMYVLHLEGEGGAQLGRGQPRQVDLAHDDLLVGHADDDPLGAEPGLGPEGAKRRGDRLGVDDLAVADGAGGEDDLAEALEDRSASAQAQLGGPHTGRADVQAHDRSSCHVESFQRGLAPRVRSHDRRPSCLRTTSARA